MLRQAKFQTDSNGKPEKLAVYMAALDMLFHIPTFSKVMMASDPLEIIGSENERAALLELKLVVHAMINGSSSENVNIQHFFYRLSTCTYSEFSRSDNVDIIQAWDDIVKLIMLVMPPMREIFLGHLESAQEVPGWLNLTTRCIRAQFSSSLQSLDDIIRACNKQVQSAGTSNSHGKSETSSPDEKNNSMANMTAEGIASSNMMVLKRSPEILVISVESSQLKSSSLLQAQGHSLSLAPNDKMPSNITFPDTFDLISLCPNILPTISKSSSSSSNLEDEENNTNNNTSNTISQWYDLHAIASLDGNSLTTLQSYFRLQITENSSDQERWYRNAGKNLEEVSKSRAIEGNFFSSSHSLDKRVHPKLLIYTRRNLSHVLERTIQLVSKGGQMRALGDVAFALAMTTDNYTEARRCYEEAISLDESLKDVLSENLLNLDKIEWTQKARNLEEQGDLALANGRHREANEQYTKSLMSAVFGSPVFMRVKEKVEYITRIIALETSCHFAEKGEDNFKSGNYTAAKDNYHQTLKLNPELIDLQLLISGIDKTLQLQLVRQKTHEANQAMKAFKYRQAHSLLLEAIALAPEERAGLQSVLDDLGPLIQCENALARQRAGIAAMEEKRHAAAVQLFTEAISLLPPNSSADHAYVLCDRGSAYFELKEIAKAMEDCEAALLLKSDYAMAYFRLGAAYFAQDLYDEASSNYEKALRFDPSMQEAIKIKQRQLNTAKEVQQRKERETERIRQQEEQKKLLEEKRLRDELIKKEKAEKLALEQAEKNERKRILEEERKTKAAKEKEIQDELNKVKEIEKEKIRLEKLERDKERAIEREKLKIEKEKEKERQKLEKEKKLLEQQKVKEEERLKQIELEKEKERKMKEKEEARIKKEAEDKLREEEEEKEKKKRIQERKIEMELKRKQKEEEDAAAAAAAAQVAANAIAAEKVTMSLSSASSSSSSSSPRSNTSDAATLPLSSKKANHKPIKILQSSSSSSITTSSTSSSSSTSNKIGNNPSTPTLWVAAVSSFPSGSTNSTGSIGGGITSSDMVSSQVTSSSSSNEQDFPPLFGSSGAVTNTNNSIISTSSSGLTAAAVVASSSSSVLSQSRGISGSNSLNPNPPTLSSIVASSGASSTKTSSSLIYGTPQPPLLQTPTVIQAPQPIMPPPPPLQPHPSTYAPKPVNSNTTQVGGLDFDFASMLQHVAPHLNQSSLGNASSTPSLASLNNNSVVLGNNSFMNNSYSNSSSFSSNMNTISRSVSAPISSSASTSGFDILSEASDTTNSSFAIMNGGLQRSSTNFSGISKTNNNLSMNSMLSNPSAVSSSSSQIGGNNNNSNNNNYNHDINRRRNDNILPSDEFQFARDNNASTTEFQPSYALMQLAEAKRMATLQDKMGGGNNQQQLQQPPPPPSPSSSQTSNKLLLKSTGVNISSGAGLSSSSLNTPPTAASAASSSSSSFGNSFDMSSSITPLGLGLGGGGGALGGNSSSVKLPGNAKIGYNRDAMSAVNAANMSGGSGGHVTSSSSGKLGLIGNSSQSGILSSSSTQQLLQQQQQQNSNGLYFNNSGLAGNDYLLSSASSSSVSRNHSNTYDSGSGSGLGGSVGTSLFGNIGNVKSLGDLGGSGGSGVLDGLSGLKSLNGLGFDPFDSTSFLDESSHNSLTSTSGGNSSSSGVGIYRDLTSSYDNSLGILGLNNNNFNNSVSLQLNDVDDPLLRALGGLSSGNSESNLPSPERGGSTGSGGFSYAGHGLGLNKALEHMYLSNNSASVSAVNASGSHAVNNRPSALPSSYSQSFNTSTSSWVGAGNDGSISPPNPLLNSPSSSASASIMKNSGPFISRNSNNTTIVSSSNSSTSIIGNGSSGTGGRPVGLGVMDNYSSSASNNSGYGSIGMNYISSSGTGTGASGGSHNIGGAAIPAGLNFKQQQLPSNAASSGNAHSFDSTTQPVIYPQGIDADIVTENLFPSVSWLRNYDMHMYRWSGDANDWTEFAMHIPSHVIAHLLGADGSNINEFKRLSNCNVWSDKEYLNNREELFLVFNRGPSGSPANGHMNTALEIISSYMSQPASLQVLNNNDSFKMSMQQQHHKAQQQPGGMNS